jgi:hypothetical protein
VRWTGRALPGLFAFAEPCISVESDSRSGLRDLAAMAARSCISLPDSPRRTSRVPRQPSGALGHRTQQMWRAAPSLGATDFGPTMLGCIRPEPTQVWPTSPLPAHGRLELRHVPRRMAQRACDSKTPQALPGHRSQVSSRPCGQPRLSPDRDSPWQEQKRRQSSRLSKLFNTVS